MRIAAAIILKCGDWGWFKQALGLRGWQGEGSLGKLCWLCQATFDPSCHCFDFGPLAKWRTIKLSMQMFWGEARTSGFYVSPIWSIPGFIVQNCKPDWMHTCCLGILQYLNGNCLWELFKELKGTKSHWNKGCTLLKNITNIFAKDTNVKSPFHSFTLGMMFPQSGKPKLG